MKEQILETLDYTFKYDHDVQKKFQNVLIVRFDKHSELFKQFKELEEGGKDIRPLLNDEVFTQELQRLNLMSLKERLKFIEENDIDETVVIAYMKLLVKEIENSSLCEGNASTDLDHSEEVMLKHLLNDAVFNDDLTEIEGISNTNLRLVFQTWVLYPQYLKKTEELKELLEALFLTSIKF